MRDRIICALDFDDPDDALDLVDQLGDDCTFYKIGLELLATGGMRLAEELAYMNKRVFLDWKLHDIGTTVERATRAIVSQGFCDILTVHATEQVVEAALRGAEGSKTKVIAVTQLTDGNDSSLVIPRASMVHKLSGHGVVCSGQEAVDVRALAGEDFVIVTPGIRPAWSTTDDQKRITTPREAFNNGASYIVVGRPITRHPNPVTAFNAILSEVSG